MLTLLIRELVYLCTDINPYANTATIATGKQNNARASLAAADEVMLNGFLVHSVPSMQSEHLSMHLFYRAYTVLSTCCFSIRRMYRLKQKKRIGRKMKHC